MTSVDLPLAERLHDGPVVIHIECNFKYVYRVREEPAIPNIFVFISMCVVLLSIY